MDDMTETLVQLALTEAQLAVNRAARQKLCARLTKSADIDRREVRALRHRIAATEADIVRDRRRRAELLERINRVDGAPYSDLLGQVA